VKALIVAGSSEVVIARQQSKEVIELGELLVCDKSKILFECINLMHGSQISQQHRELISGLQLEEDHKLHIMDPELRNYTIAELRPLVRIGNTPALCKTIPPLFSPLRALNEKDMEFLQNNKSLHLGFIRSGSSTLNTPLTFDAPSTLSHHILIAGTTGRGKSHLMKHILWNLSKSQDAGLLVLDPHDEYIGRNEYGLKDHPSNSVVYYSTRPIPGSMTLTIHLSTLKPSHFRGILSWSDPQYQAVNAYYKKYGKEWIESIILEKPLSVDFFEGTIAVIKRTLLNTLDLEWNDNQLYCHGLFSLQSGLTTINDICNSLENGKITIIDTSRCAGAIELLIGSMITTEIFRRYKRYKNIGEEKNVVSIVLEEAPRVIGKDALERGSNIFSTIAREGRKFNVGLIAITQLPSLIPRDILANMNTKIILGLEMAPERHAIIESAAHDLSKNDRTIASLDKGEAIVTSSLVKFPMPVSIPLFAKENYEEKTKLSLTGVSLS